MAYTKVKSPIVYYGGKTSILNHLLERVPIHETYTETFFGGGTLFWAKDPVKNETINDKLDLVINFYRVLRSDFPKLKKLIEATLIGRSIHNQALAVIRRHKTNNKVNRVQLAWAFWVATNFAFSNKVGGGYKYSNDMSVSVPATLKRRKENFTELMVHRIENAYIENDDAIKILRSRNTSKAFHYLDPPYPGTDQGHYAGYKFEEYHKLLSWCADECKGKFLLSSYNSEMLTEFIQSNGWYKKEITHRLSGSKSLNSRNGRISKGFDHRTEVLVSNYATPCGTLKLF